MKHLGATSILAAAVAAGSADAYIIRFQFVHRIGDTDMIIPEIGGVPTLFARPGETIRIRNQFGAFDDANGPAPAGGYIGWNVGTQSLTNGQTATRTPGRLAPFNFAPDPPSNGVPSTDPFTALTAIDNTLGTQLVLWHCNPDGTIPPPPPPVVRGLNSFVSTWEFTFTFIQDFDANFGGNIVFASGWSVLGHSCPPDCGDPNDPDDDIPGVMHYAPMNLAPIPSQWQLRVRLIPGPNAAAVLGVGGLIALRRRRG